MVGRGAGNIMILLFFYYFFLFINSNNDKARCSNERTQIAGRSLMINRPSILAETTHHDARMVLDVAAMRLDYILVITMSFFSAFKVKISVLEFCEFHV